MAEIAQGKPASANYEDTGNNLKAVYLTDGDMNTRWAETDTRAGGSDGNANLAADPSKLIIDLESKQTAFESISVYYHMKAYAAAYKVETSEDGKDGSWTMVADIEKGDSGMQKPVDVLTADGLQIQDENGAQSSEISIAKGSVLTTQLQRFLRFTISKRNGSAAGLSIREIKIMGEQSNPVYTVQFDSDGGSEVPPQTKQPGEKVDEPEPPSKQGYIFSHWYAGDDPETAYDFANATVTGRLTLRAKWVEIPPIDIQAGWLSASSTETGQLANLVDENLTTEWRSGKLAAESSPNDGDPAQWLAVDLQKAETELQSVEIVWAAPRYPKKISIQTSATGEDGSWRNLYENANQTMSGAGGAAATVSYTQFSGVCLRYIRFYFENMNADAAMRYPSIYEIKIKGTQKDAEAVPAAGVTVAPSDVTLTAAGATEALTATVTPENATDRTVTWDSSDESVATVSADGVVTAVANGEATITAAANGAAAGADVKGTASVTVRIPANVTFRANAGTDVVTGMPGNTTVAIGQSLSKPAETPLRTGYKFKGWSRTADGAVLADADWPLAVAADIELFAIWEEEPQCSCEIETLTVSGNTLELAVGEESGEITLTPEVTKKAGCAVEGHPQDNAVTYAYALKAGEPNTANASVNPVSGKVTVTRAGTATVTVTASLASGAANRAKERDVKLTVTKAAAVVTFHANGGVFGGGETTKEVTSDDDGYVAAPAEPTRTDYAFNGWYTLASGGNQIAFTDGKFKPDSNMQLFAHWIDNSAETHTVTFKADAADETAFATQTVAEGEHASRPAQNPKKAGYAFLGWYLADAEYLFDTAIVTADITLVAKWQEKTVTAISLNLTEKKLTEKDETVELIVAFTPEDVLNKGITWTTSNPAVATVSENGLVTAVANGETTVTATAQGSEKGSDAVTASAVITVEIMSGGTDPQPSEVVQGKPATANFEDLENNFKAVYLTDGDMETRWAEPNDRVGNQQGQGNEVLAANPSELLIDLQSQKTVFESISIYYHMKAYASIYKIETGDHTNGPWTMVADVEKGNADSQKTVDVLTEDGLKITEEDGSPNSAVSVIKGTVLGTALKRFLKITISKRNENAAGLSIREIKMSGVQEGDISATHTVTLHYNAGDKPDAVKTVADGTALTESDLAEGIYDGHIFVGWFTDAACTQAYVLGPVTTDIELYAKWQEEAAEKPVTALSLSPAEKTLKSKGETVDLAVSFTPSDATNKEIIWNSSDPEVATVADGRVTAVANGETTITATAQGAADGDVVTAEAEIRVEIPEAENPVTAISLNPTEKTLKSKGETVDLAVSFTPSDATNKEIIWNSSDPEVATVADGRVTAVANGETTITATAQGAADGNIVTAEAKIRVEIPAVAKPVTGISLSPEKKTLTKKDETAELNVSFTPDDATDKTLDWGSSDTGVATVKDGIVTAVADGVATITATAQGSADGKDPVTASAEITVLISSGGDEDPAVAEKKEELREEINKAKKQLEEIDKSKYTPDSIKALEEAIAKAKEEMEKDGVTAESLKKRLDEIRGIRLETLIEAAKRAELKTAVRDAYKGITTAYYTSASLKKLQDAVKSAEKLVANGATAEELTRALNAIKTAKRGLTLHEYKVTFSNNRGVIIETKKVKAGQKVKAPVDPKLDGYTFGGWYSNSICTLKYNFSSAVTKNITLFAKWTKKPAEEDLTMTDSKKITYQIKDKDKKQAIVVSCGDKNVKNVTIPAEVTIKGIKCKVVAIGEDAFKECKKLKSVTIGKNVQIIEKNAFLNCKKLKKIILKGKALKKVKNKAFKNTAKNLKVKAPKGMKKAQKKKLLRILKKGGNKKIKAV